MCAHAQTVSTEHAVPVSRKQSEPRSERRLNLPHEPAIVRSNKQFESRKLTAFKKRGKDKGKNVCISKNSIQHQVL